MRTRKQIVLLALIGLAAFAGSALVDRLFFRGRDGATGQVRRPRSAQPIPTVDADTPPQARVLRFPKKAGAGEYVTADWSTIRHFWWRQATAAKGDVQIPAGQSVKLKLFPAKPTIWRKALSKTGIVHGDPQPSWAALGALKPDDIQAPELQNVTLRGNDLTIVAEMTGLREPHMDNVSLQGARLTHLTKLGSLRVLDILSTNVGDEGAEQIARLSELRVLLLGGVGLTDEALRHLSALPKIEALDFAANKITDAGLVHVKKLKSLRTLSPANNRRVKDAGMKPIGEMTWLTGLNLNETSIGDAGLAHLKNLTNLTYIFMEVTNVTDAGLVHLHGMKKLRSLDLQGCRGITLEGVEKFKDAVPNCRVIHHAGR